MTSIESVTLEVPDPAAGEAFYAAASGLGDKVRARASDAPTAGFRGFTLSLVVSQPSTVDSLIGTALVGGATTLKPAAKGFWGYGGVVQDPGGAIWKVATSSKKDTGQASREIDHFVLLLGVGNVKAARQFYLDHGLAVVEELRQQVRRVPRPVVAYKAGSLQPPGRRQRRGRLPGRHRITPDRHLQRRRALHRPGRVRVGGRTAVSRAAQHNHHVGSPQCTTAPNHASHATTTRQEGNVQ